MREFVDNQGKTWQVKLDVAAMKRIKTRLGFIPGTPGTPDVDLCVMADTLYAACVADPDTMPQEQFDGRLDGVLGNAIAALEGETSDFTHRENLAGTPPANPE